ncbi:cellulase family glycosylhydrolase [Amycolatopsis sp. CA-126428]|uniref:cellulase family glycosylhydrolase n=1 Tax=Amycolatopsis sp. CA-126428 TaxID=2073158 RepID=UPI001304FA1B|nr:cellulase family glycosylhydrolase [Amycolatopsis sp. CA-126428]
MNRWPGRGINFGNVLDALGDGPELPLDGRYFDEVAEAGFATVRLPVRWSAHAQAEPPYAIDPAFARRVDAGVAAALDRGQLTAARWNAVLAEALAVVRAADPPVR